MKNLSKVTALALLISLGGSVVSPAVSAKPNYEEIEKRKKAKTKIMGERTGKKVVKAFDLYNEENIDGALALLLELKPSNAFDKATVAVEAAKAKRSRAEIHLKQMIVRAPEDATILQINIHKGEFATAQTDNGHILLGQTEKMQVRLDIDEAEAWRYKKGSQAKAYLRGNSTIAFDLDFDHVEPFILPKTSLTSRNTEKVDTRVLQVIYSFETPAKNVYVGQQVDVIIEDVQDNKEET